MLHMLKRDGLLWNWRLWRDGLQWTWGKQGIFRPLIGAYLDFFKAGFHPWQHNNLDLLAKFSSEFEPAASTAA